MKVNGTAQHYLLEAYKHLKAIALCGDAGDLASHLRLDVDAGLICAPTAKDLGDRLVVAMARHRVWAREPKAMSVPA